MLLPAWKIPRVTRVASTTSANPSFTVLRNLTLRYGTQLHVLLCCCCFAAREAQLLRTVFFNMNLPVGLQGRSALCVVIEHAWIVRAFLELALPRNASHTSEGIWQNWPSVERSPCWRDHFQKRRTWAQHLQDAIQLTRVSHLSPYRQGVLRKYRNR